MIKHERKLTNSQIAKYVKNNLTKDVFVTSSKEVLIYYNSKIYRMKIDSDTIMLSKEDATTGSAFDWGTLEFLMDKIKTDPYPWYHNQTKEFFESLKPVRERMDNGDK